MRSPKSLSVALMVGSVVFSWTTGTATQTSELRIAAAADLQFAMSDLASQFERGTGSKVDVTYGSSGNFYSQIKSGAPFDLFFSADIEYPRKLEAAGLTEPGTLYEYALGRIVIWAPSDSPLDVAERSWSALRDPGVQKIAIANPEHAPYGRAAVAALKKAGIYEQVHAKLVYGENISQAAQFVQSGNAQVGIIALSLAVSPAMQSGRRYDVPCDMHSPIVQAAVVLKTQSNTAAAKSFLLLVKSNIGRQILERYGFTPPADDAKAPTK